ncbi:MAG: hypothetical protein KC438_13000, partial [Thermomicrobiales bacterium]|nr:hypothetical protein [Thermomicrobiales bacterium]
MSSSAPSRSRLQSAHRPGLRSIPLIAALALSSALPAGVTAQSATPVATSTCAPSSMIAAPTVPDSVATPQAVSAVDAETNAAITTLIDSLASCLTDGNADTVAALVTDRYLADAYGGGERMTREDYLALAPLAPIVPVMVVSVGEITFSGRDTAVAQVITVQGNQLRTEDWTFLFRRSRDTTGTPGASNTAGEGQWLVHQVELRPSSAPQGASAMKGT